MREVNESNGEIYSSVFPEGREDDEVDEEAERIKVITIVNISSIILLMILQAERIAAYNARKSAKEDKKGKVIAKSNIILDIKPWDDETDMAKLEESVRSVSMDGLLWGTGKLVAVGYGIKKVHYNSQTMTHH